MERMIYREMPEQGYFMEARKFLIKEEGDRNFVYLDNLGIPTTSIGKALIVKGSNGKYVIDPKAEEILESSNVILPPAQREKLLIAADNLSKYDKGKQALAENMQHFYKSGTSSTWEDRTLDEEKSTFGLIMTKQQQYDVGNAVVKHSDENLSNLLADTTNGKSAAFVPPSQERMSLLSLAHNTPGLIGPAVKKNLANGDRDGVYNEIKNRSNKPNKNGVKSQNVQERRDRESAIFGNSQNPEVRDNELLVHSAQQQAGQSMTTQQAYEYFKENPDKLPQLEQQDGWLKVQERQQTQSVVPWVQNQSVEVTFAPDEENHSSILDGLKKFGSKAASTTAELGRMTLEAAETFSPELLEAQLASGRHQGITGEIQTAMLAKAVAGQLLARMDGIVRQEIEKQQRSGGFNGGFGGGMHVPIPDANEETRGGIEKTVNHPANQGKFAEIGQRVQRILAHFEDAEPVSTLVSKVMEALQKGDISVPTHTVFVPDLLPQADGAARQPSKEERVIQVGGVSIPVRLPRVEVINDGTGLDGIGGGISALDKGADGTIRVRGYTRGDGTQVAAHTRTAPDGVEANNLSFKNNRLKIRK